MTEQMDKPMAGLVTELQFHSDASKVEVWYWYRLVLLKMSYLDLRSKMDSELTPTPNASF